MKIASLYDCFARHLNNLSLNDEAETDFVTTVVEKYLIHLGDHGYSFASHAEDTFTELCDEVRDMLKKKIYGYHSLEQYRRAREQNSNEK